MSEKKYYVALKCDLSHRMSREIDGIGHFFHSTNEEIKSSKFTKSELGKIMGGAIYKSKFRHETQDELWRNGWTIREDKVNGCTHWEWINPLIELVPVEDGE